MTINPNLLIKSLRVHIDSLADKSTEKVALLQCNEDAQIVKEITYEVLAQEIETAAGYLAGLGLKKEDRVAFDLELGCVGERNRHGANGHEARYGRALQIQARAEQSEGSHSARWRS